MNRLLLTPQVSHHRQLLGENLLRDNRLICCDPSTVSLGIRIRFRQNLLNLFCTLYSKKPALSGLRFDGLRDRVGSQHRDSPRMARELQYLIHRS